MQLPLNDDVVGQFSAELTAGSSLVSAAAVSVPAQKNIFGVSISKKSLRGGQGGYGAWSRIN
jgi:hypothetical protein